LPARITIYAVGIEGESPQASVMPARPSWGEDAGSAAPSGVSSESAPARTQPVRRGKLFRRGFALILDYMIVGGTCLAAALVINSSVNPTVVRMDLDLPFVEYGDVVDREQWQTVETKVEDNARIVTQERLVTYSYWDLFQQTYRQTRTRGGVTIREGKEKPASAEPAQPAAPAPAAVPAPAAAPAVPVPPPPASAVPPPPPAPPAPTPPAPPVVPNVVVEDGKVTIDGQLSPTSKPSRKRRRKPQKRRWKQPRPRRAAAGRDELPDEDDPGVTLGMRRDRETGGLRFFGSYISEQLVDRRPVATSRGRRSTRSALSCSSSISP
jgi:hypothetical protein